MRRVALAEVLGRGHGGRRGPAGGGGVVDADAEEFGGWVGEGRRFVVCDFCGGWGEGVELHFDQEAWWWMLRGGRGYGLDVDGGCLALGIDCESCA